MAEFGVLEGLSGDLQYDQRINDARWQQQNMERAKAKAAASAQMFADDFSKGPVGSQYDDPIIKDYTRKRMQDAVKIMKDNPNYKYDPDSLSQIKAIKDDIKGNEHVLRAMSYVDAKNKLKEDLAEVAKNPNQYDQEAYNDILNRQMQNYNQYGHQDGLEAFQKEGAQPFIYRKPQDFVGDLSGDLHKTGLGIKDFKVIQPKDGNSGEFWTMPTEDALNAATDAKYQQHQRQIEVQGKKMGLVTPEQQKDWIKQNILAGFDKEYHLGDPDAAFNKSMRLKEYELSKEKAQKQIGGSYTPHDYLIDPNTRAGTIPTDVLNKVLSDKPNVIIQGNNGGKADLTGFNFDYDGRFVQRAGIPMVFGSLKIPVDVAKQKGIIGYNIKTGDDDRISSDYMGKAVIVPNKNAKGEDDPYVQVSAQLPINPKDQGFRQRYNALMDVDKLVPASQNPYQSNSKVYEGSENDFKSAGWNDSQIKEGIQKGIIKIK